MALFPGRKLGSRTLCLGHKGPDVTQLHAFLRLQGYDLGSEPDFGYLTKDAVRLWQRDHGLVADGIAGKRFFALALKKDVPVQRTVHVVGPQETLAEIAKKYEVGIEAFGAPLMSQKPIYSGQRLVFFERELWGLCKSEAKLDTPRGKLTGLICPDHPGASLPEPYVIRPAAFEQADEVAVHAHLKTPRRRRRMASEFLSSFPGSRGLYLPWQAVEPVDGRRYLKLLQFLRKRLKPPAMLWVELGPKVPSWTLWGGVDYALVNQLVDRIVLSLPPPLEPGPIVERRRAEELVDSLLPAIHSWKILLKVPVYALEWETGAEGDEACSTLLPYQTALSRALRQGARLSQDERGYPYYTYKKRGASYQIRLPQHSLMAEMSLVANRHNLAGLILDGLGLEDPRIWATARCFRTAALNNSQE
ncbi:MAG: peptidoglycan-binding protein [Limnochordia bacterium]|jgi:hypothetical protein|nr:peptidoglycan-binding protein [Limnochordia bacterium]